MSRLGQIVRKRFFTPRVVGHWHWLPREAVTALPDRVQAYGQCSEAHTLSLLGCPVQGHEMDSRILVGAF